MLWSLRLVVWSDDLEVESFNRYLAFCGYFQSCCGWRGTVFRKRVKPNGSCGEVQLSRL